MLLSSYDFRERFDSDELLNDLLNRYSRNGVLLLDSGCYESYWYNNNGWKFDKYEEILRKYKYDIFTSYDPFLGISDSIDNKESVYNNHDNYLASASKSATFLPIFHSCSPQGLIDSVVKYLEKDPYSVEFIAVTEKECGITLSDRAQTVMKLRQKINFAGNGQALHILGCGHPLSIALYCYSGADSFDSKDWLRNVVDIQSLNLKDFSQLELLHCKCEACKTTNPVARVFYHNIAAYLQFTNQLTELIKKNELKSYLQEKIGRDALNRLDS
jgi:hypothetical protein